MSERVIESEYGRKMLLKEVEEHALPFVCTLIEGKRRSIDQNRMQMALCKEAAKLLGDSTPEEVRGYCKLTLGIPILQAASEAWRWEYDTVLKPFDYETRLRLMMQPHDYPVTRRMTTKQMTEYLDSIPKHFAEVMGIVLTTQDRAA